MMMMNDDMYDNDTIRCGVPLIVTAHAPRAPRNRNRKNLTQHRSKIKTTVAKKQVRL